MIYWEIDKDKDNDEWWKDLKNETDVRICGDETEQKYSRDVKEEKI